MRFPDSAAKRPRARSTPGSTFAAPAPARSKFAESCWRMRALPRFRAPHSDLRARASYAFHLHRQWQICTKLRQGSKKLLRPGKELSSKDSRTEAIPGLDEEGFGPRGTSMKLCKNSRGFLLCIIAGLSVFAAA